MTMPFRVDSIVNYLWEWKWNDRSSGGKDWSIHKCINPPVGFARLGDIPVMGHGSPDLNNTQGRNIAFISQGLPFSKPADDFTLSWFTQNYYWVYGWVPISNDPDFVGVGMAFTNNPNVKPSTSDYYVINKALIKTTGNGGAQGINQQEGGTPYMEGNGGTFYFNFDNVLLFTKDSNKYLAYNLDNLKSSCMGKSSNYSYASPGSQFCDTYMKHSCTDDDIKLGGKCSSWCSADNSTCDSIKVDYCNVHPNDTWCDCINASSRTSYATEMSMLSAQGKLAPKPCKTELCRDRGIDTSTFVLSADAQFLNNCPNIDYIDQSVKITGDNNVAQTNQNVTKNTGTNSPTDTLPKPADVASPTIMGIKSSYFWIILLFIFIIVAAIIYKKNSNVLPQPKLDV